MNIVPLTNVECKVMRDLDQELIDRYLEKIELAKKDTLLSEELRTYKIQHYKSSIEWIRGRNDNIKKAEIN